MSHVVLLADDDAAIRMVLNQALTRAGYEVRPTGNISTMWNWVSRGEGDVLITDVAMPDGNAFEVMPKIKKVRPDLPMIVMSAQNTFMTAIRASEVGAYEYLPKPFDITEVLSVVMVKMWTGGKPEDVSVIGLVMLVMVLVFRWVQLRFIKRRISTL